MSKYLVELAFVRGHQDTRHPIVLTQDAWLNVEADLLAKAKVSVSFTSPLHYTLPSNPWGCYMGNQQIVTQLQLSLDKQCGISLFTSYSIE